MRRTDGLTDGHSDNRSIKLGMHVVEQYTCLPGLDKISPSSDIVRK